jgi:hypothetical protein
MSFEQQTKANQIVIIWLFSDQIRKVLSNIFFLSFLSLFAIIDPHEEQLKSQIKHIDEQIRGVAFLLMQAQIGLENCSDTYSISAASLQLRTNENKTSTDVLETNSIDAASVG